MPTTFRWMASTTVMTFTATLSWPMATTAATVKKSGRWPFKKSAVGGKKTVACVIPSDWHLPIGKKANHFLYRRKPDFFLPPTADFLYLRLFSLPSGRRGWGWRGIAESSLSRYYTTHTDAQGEALKSHKSFCSVLCEYIQRISKRMRHITPTAKRNTYSVAFWLCI